MTADDASARPPDVHSDQAVRIERPTIDDGVELWRLARDSKVLDVNSRYAYLLWCRDFAATSVVARLDGRTVGFVTGYRRPDEPATLMVWQVAVDAEARGLGLAGRMLDALYDGVAEADPLGHLETTITPDNAASIALFASFARRRGADVDVTPLFRGDQLAGPDDEPAHEPGHEPENRYRIGPITATVRSS